VPIVIMDDTYPPYKNSFWVALCSS
jgi:hypothetical protein